MLFQNLRLKPSIKQVNAFHIQYWTPNYVCKLQYEQAIAAHCLRAFLADRIRYHAFATRAMAYLPVRLISSRKT